MWTRREIKTKAKEFLKEAYVKAFIVCIIASFILGNLYESGSNEIMGNIKSGFNHKFEYSLDEYDDNISSEDLTIAEDTGYAFLGKVLNVPGMKYLAILGPLMYILAILYRLFIANPIGLGRSKFFLKAARDEEDVDISYLWSPFNKEDYMGVVGVQFRKNLYIALMTMLLVVPGIIKYYQLRLVEYIKVDRPDLTNVEILDLSKELTNGHKWNIFVLDLSFIGWYLLGGIFFGIGHLFVNPYLEATYAQLYLDLVKHREGYLPGEDGVEVE